MAFPSTTGKVHYRSGAPRAAGLELLFCSGRSMSFGLHTRMLDEVTCRACRRKLVKQARASLGAAT